MALCHNSSNLTKPIFLILEMHFWPLSRSSVAIFLQTAPGAVTVTMTLPYMAIVCPSNAAEMLALGGLMIQSSLLLAYITAFPQWVATSLLPPVSHTLLIYHFFSLSSRREYVITHSHVTRSVCHPFPSSITPI